MNEAETKWMEGVVRECSTPDRANEGMFALMQASSEAWSNAAFMESFKALCALDVEQNRFKAAPNYTIFQWLAKHAPPQGQGQKNLTAMLLHQGRGVMLRCPIHAIRPLRLPGNVQGWSLAGLCLYLSIGILDDDEKFSFVTVMKGVPKLTRAPDLGPVIARRTYSDPVGAWIPAYVVDGISHDLMDLAVETMQPRQLDAVLKYLEPDRVVAQTLGRYLGLHAARAYDLMQPLADLLGEGDDPDGSKKRLKAELERREFDGQFSTLIARLFVAGARLTPEQWNGPASNDAAHALRPLGQGAQRVAQLAYCIMAYHFSDAEKVQALTNLAYDGHDVTACREGSTSSLTQPLPVPSPLHYGAAFGNVQTLRMLLDHGADPGAVALRAPLDRLVHSDDYPAPLGFSLPGQFFQDIGVKKPKSWRIPKELPQTAEQVALSMDHREAAQLLNAHTQRNAID